MGNNQNLNGYIQICHGNANKNHSNNFYLRTLVFNPNIFNFIYLEAKQQIDILADF